MTKTSAAASLRFHAHFEAVDDPRVNRSIVHSFIDLRFLAVTATLAVADGPSDIEQFGKEKIDWLRRFVKLSGGIPSHDTIGRVFALLRTGKGDDR